VTSRAERIADGLQGSLLQTDIIEIVVHEADEPNAVVGFLDAGFLTGEHGRDMDLFSLHADAAAGDDPRSWQGTRARIARGM
jgi:hypothetical protein